MDGLGNWNSDDDIVTLARTNGDWDSVHGIGKTLTIDAAQANVYGTFRNIYLTGSDAAISLYGDAGAEQAISGSNSTIVVNGHAGNTISGGGDRIYVAPSMSPLLTLLGTNGNWDTVVGATTGLVLENAQTSVFGGGNVIYAGHAGDAVSLYDTAGVDDSVNDGRAAVTFNDAQATLSGAGYYAYFSAGRNSASLISQSDDILAFAGVFGQDTIAGFNASDTIQLNASQFADFQAFQNAFAQQGDDAVLTLDADDKVTFVGVQTGSVSASQVKFV